jgi:hypothetical protein
MPGGVPTVTDHVGTPPERQEHAADRSMGWGTAAMTPVPPTPPLRLAPAWAAATNPSRRTVGTIATGAVQVSGTSAATSGLE